MGDLARQRQVANPYTQNADGNVDVVFKVDAADMTSNKIATGTTAKTIEFLQTGNYTLIPDTDITWELARQERDASSVTVTAATAASPDLPADQMVNFFFTKGSKLSVRSGAAGNISIVPSDEF